MTAFLHAAGLLLIATAVVLVAAAGVATWLRRHPADMWLAGASTLCTAASVACDEIWFGAIVFAVISVAIFAFAARSGRGSTP